VVHQEGTDLLRFGEIFSQILTAVMSAYFIPYFIKEPYHTSALSGENWVLELRHGHPKRIQCELGVRHHVFEHLLWTLRHHGLSDERDITLHEQLAIFLYTCVTGLSTRHVGERFQHSHNTIAKYVYQSKISCLIKPLG
jgi:hypothetical protein